MRINPASTDLRDETELTCETSFDLTFRGAYYWMKDGKYFTYTQSPKMLVSISGDAGSFSCYHAHGDHKHVSSSVCEC